MLINRNNYEEFFLMYVDGELSAGDRIAVEKFAAANPDLLKELNLLKETVLVADNEIGFEHKEELYKETNRKVIGFAWWRIAATVILLFGTGIWGFIYLNQKEVENPQVATTSPTLDTEFLPPAIADVKKEVAIAPSDQVASATPTARQHTKVNNPAHQAVEKENTAENKEIKLDLPMNLTTTSIEPPTENIAITIVPQKLNEEKTNEQIYQSQNKTLIYEYVDPLEDDMIYVANTSVSKRNKFRGVIRKATRILDRVTSSQ